MDHPISPTSAVPPVPDSIILAPDILQRLDFPALFGSSAPVELELGAGDGSFLLRHTAQNPEHHFIGVERLLGRLRKIDRKGRRLGLRNLRVLRLEASYVLEWMIPPGSLAAIHVYFPDPWPKRRHWKRRLINHRFTSLAARALQPGGILFVRTDDVSYFEQMVEVGNAQPAFSPTREPDTLLALKTDFETHFNQKGIPTQHAAWQRLPGEVVVPPPPLADLFQPEDEEAEDEDAEIPQ